MKWVAGVLLIVGLIYLSFLGYRRLRDDRELTNGTIHSSDLMTRAQQEDFDRQHGADAWLSPNDARTSPEGVPANQSGLDSPLPADASLYSGRGRFQWYRQANITYRLDTETGHSCVVYATLEEWRKPLVKSNGCTDVR